MEKVYESIINDFLSYIEQKENVKNEIDKNMVKIFIRDRFLNGINTVLQTKKCENKNCNKIIKNKYQYCDTHQNTQEDISNLIKKFQNQL